MNKVSPVQVLNVSPVRNFKEMILEEEEPQLRDSEKIFIEGSQIMYLKRNQVQFNSYQGKENKPNSQVTSPRRVRDNGMAIAENEEAGILRIPIDKVTMATGMR